MAMTLASVAALIRRRPKKDDELERIEQATAAPGEVRDVAPPK